MKYMGRVKVGNMAGTLYLCATPIGNLEDITYRTVRILGEVDLIAAEDTRHSIKLLNHFNIKTPMTSYHEFNKYDKAIYLVSKLLEGANIAIITDAGTPGISDPGEELVRQCHKAGVKVEALPGPCALIAAVTSSGLPTRRFAFEAFLPMDKKERRLILEELKSETRTIVLHEAPHRLIKTLEELLEVLGTREVAVCRELTKKYETIHRFTLEEAMAYFKETEPKGEIVLVVKGKDQEEIRKEAEEKWESMPLAEHMDIYINQGKDKKTAMKLVAADRGIAKRDVYKQLLEE